MMLFTAGVVSTLIVEGFLVILLAVRLDQTLTRIVR
jgi:hypothetical protein